MLVEKIKVKVYVNQVGSLSHIKIRHAYDFSLCFPHELLMSFCTHYLKHEQPIFVSNTNSSRRREFVYQIKIGCECFNVYLKNDPSYEFIGEVILKINIV